MTSTLDALQIRARLGRDNWSAPRPHGPDGWAYLAKHDDGSVIVSCAAYEDGAEWVHASIAWSARLPSYDDLVLLHRAVWADHGYAYQVFAPASRHVNIHPHALHIFGLLSGANVLPDFAPIGTI